MPHFLAENPWPLAGAFGLVGLASLIALRVTQDGKHLVRGLVAIGGAGLVLLVEALWVTDTERVEAVVRQVADALRRSDPDALIGHLDRRVSLGLPGMMGSTIEIDPQSLRDRLREVTFDWVHLSRLSADGGSRTRRGSAEFRLSTSGTYHMAMGSRNFAGNSDWSFGFRKDRDDTWRVNRITAVSIPGYAALPISRLGADLRKARPGPAEETAADVGPPAPPPGYFRRRGR